MSGDKRAVSTGALETLGTIIDQKAGGCEWAGSGWKDSVATE